MGEPLLDAALAYARLGLPVFACSPGRKTPRTPNGFHDATTDEETIRTWWRAHPRANIGMPTGAVSGLIVLDIDPRNGGDAGVDALLAEHGALPVTVESLTGAGGRHLFLQHPGGCVPCSQGELAPGVDVKGDGGYVVLPPSVHPSGDAYAWAESRAITECAPAVCPSWLAECIRKDAPMRRSPSSAEDANPIPEGQRNATLTRLAGGMRRNGMGREEIIAAMQVTNRQRCHPPLPEPEVERIAASVARYAPDAVSVALVEDHYASMFGGMPPTDPAGKLQLIRADQIEIRRPDWLLRGMLERDTLALVFGDPGCGKSFLAIDWACRIATGTPWREHAVTTGPVVYVAGEGRNGLGRRLRAWQAHHDASLDGAALHIAPAVAITDAEQLRTLVTAVEACTQPPALVVLDTLARCFGGGDENSTQDMSQFVAACDALRRRWGSTVLVVHHTGHGDKSRARGAIALKAALDAEYRLTNETQMLLTATKMKDAETPPPLGLELVTVELPHVVDDYGNPVTSAAIEVVDADISAIESQAKATAGLGRKQKEALDIARRLAAETSDGTPSLKAWHAACEQAQMGKSTRYKILCALQERGLVNVGNDVLILH
ncbi:MAG: bifunctional DNA primase/polymerase [Phycisphaerae bacterium]|nr:bifunctional DNA primase/polymerase [Phycisphaerae bacterium]